MMDLKQSFVLYFSFKVKVIFLYLKKQDFAELLKLKTEYS